MYIAIGAGMDIVTDIIFIIALKSSGYVDYDFNYSKTYK